MAYRFVQSGERLADEMLLSALLCQHAGRPQTANPVVAASDRFVRTRSAGTGVLAARYGPDLYLAYGDALGAADGPGVWLERWLSNLDAGPVHRADFTGSVHAGFADVLDGVWPSVMEALEVVGVEQASSLRITGHSRGAALAHLTVARLERAGVSPDVCITFGGPRVGDGQFARSLTSPIWRVESGYDLVPFVPPADQLLPLALLVGKPGLSRLFTYRHAGARVLVDPIVGPPTASVAGTATTQVLQSQAGRRARRSVAAVVAGLRQGWQAAGGADGAEEGETDDPAVGPGPARTDPPGAGDADPLSRPIGSDPSEPSGAIWNAGGQLVGQLGRYITGEPELQGPIEGLAYEIRRSEGMLRALRWEFSAVVDAHRIETYVQKVAALAPADVAELVDDVSRGGAGSDWRTRVLYSRRGLELPSTPCPYSPVFLTSRRAQLQRMLTSISELEAQGLSVQGITTDLVHDLLWDIDHGSYGVCWAGPDSTHWIEPELLEQYPHHVRCGRHTSTLVRPQSEDPT
jgi:hypothetical protein